MKTNISGCKECGKELPKLDKTMIQEAPYEAVIIYACQKLRLCRYCYDAFAPEPDGPGPMDELMALVNMDYDNTDDDEESPYGWLDQFHGDMR